MQLKVIRLRGGQGVKGTFLSSGSAAGSTATLPHRNTPGSFNAKHRHHRRRLSVCLSIHPGCWLASGSERSRARATGDVPSGLCQFQGRRQLCPCPAAHGSEPVRPPPPGFILIYVFA